MALLAKEGSGVVDRDADELPTTPAPLPPRRRIKAAPFI